MTEQEYRELETEVTNGQLLITQKTTETEFDSLDDKEQRVVMYPAGEPVLTPPPKGYTGKPTPAQSFCMRIGKAVPRGTKLLIRLKSDGLELFDMTIE